MVRLEKNAFSWIAKLVLCAALAAVGCDDDAKDDKDHEHEGEPDAGEPSSDPIYLYTVATTNLDGDGTLYGLLRNDIDLDISADDLTKEKARPFPGYSGVAVIDHQVVVGDSQSPFATKYNVSDGFEWEQVGNKLNFGDYVTDDVDGLNFYFQAIRGTDMYFFYGADRTSRLHWNTKEWKLKEAYEDTKLPTRAGWTLGSTGNRTGVRDFKGPIVQTFNLTEDETSLVADESWVGVYDQSTHKEKSVIEVPCPGLEQTTMDEEGRLYLSTTFNVPTLALYGDAPASCVVRLNKDGTLDKSFGQHDLREWTGGFYGVNFRYLANNMAVANVLHHDRIKGADWDGPVDSKVVVEIGGEWTDEGYTPEDATLWEIHLIDLEKGTSKIITGFKGEHDPSSYTIYVPVEDRIFINHLIDPFGDARNSIYELDVETAKVKYVGDVAGELYDVQRVR